MELMDRYETLKQKVTDRKDPFDRFIKLLEGETTWITSPASTRFHLSEDQGLLNHSVGVTETLVRFREFLAPAITEESCVIVGLFHDAGKLGMPGKPLYLPNDNEWMVKNRGIRYKINPDVVAMGLAVRSLYLVTQYIPLTDAESQAIAYHDGQYIDDNKIVAHKEAPLTVVGCWLVRHGIAQGESALEKIRDLRRFDAKAHWPSPEMPYQIRMVLSWEKGQ